MSETVKVNHAPLMAKPRSAKANNGSTFAITLPLGCEALGHITKDVETVVHLDNIFVPHRLRGNKIGERLVKGFTVASQRLGATVLEAVVVKPEVVTITEKIFKAAELQFLERSEGIETELPLTIAQATDSLARAQSVMNALTPETFDPAHAYNPSILLRVALDVDTSSWQEASINTSRLSGLQ